MFLPASRTASQWIEVFRSPDGEGAGGGGSADGSSGTGEGTSTADAVYPSTAQGAGDGQDGATDGGQPDNGGGQSADGAADTGSNTGDGEDAGQGDGQDGDAGDGDGAPAEPVAFEFTSTIGDDSPVNGLVEAINASITDGGDRDAVLTAAAQWAEDTMLSGAQKIEDGITQWREALENDPEFGGDKFPETVQRIDQAFEALEDPEFASLLEGNGMKYHPVLAKGLIKLSEMVTGDTFEGSGGQPAMSLPDQIYHTTRANGG